MAPLSKNWLLEPSRWSWSKRLVFDRAHPLSLARAALLPTACVVTIVYFAVHAVTGNAGLIAWQSYKAQHVAVTGEAARVAAEKIALARQVALLDPRHVDHDLADELVRRDLGTIRSDEVILPLPDAK